MMIVDGLKQIRASKLLIAAFVIAGLSACASKPTSAASSSATSNNRPSLIDLMYPDVEVDQTAIDTHALGSQNNPVRAHMPPGQRAYLSSLICPDGQAPKYQREGAAGLSPYGRVMDAYTVQCANNDPQVVFLDMYHPDYIETRPVEGFDIKSGG